MNGDPLANFLTWMTHGSWLPGDERGWVKWHDGSQQPSEPLRNYSAAQMVESPVKLDTQQRDLVDATIRRHCEIRGWSLHALNVRTNHVHVVVTAIGCAHDNVVEQLKTWCTRKQKELDSIRSNMPALQMRWWSEGASKRFINSESDFASAGEYVLEAQDCPR